MGMRRKSKYLIPILLLASLILVGCAPAPNFSISLASLPVANQDANDILDPASSTFSPEVIEIINRIRPAVVAIDAEIPTHNISGQPTTEEVAGTGWILNQSGFIVTNSHVVAGAENVSVTLENGQSYAPKIIRTDPVEDLAVLDIGVSNLTGVKMGDSSKVRIGDQVIAIGNALGEQIKATQGIISATNSTFTVDNRETLYNTLETTASIAHGNSGGPLINMDGKVIGIITGACLTRAGVEVMGYAISSDNAAPIIRQLSRDGGGADDTDIAQERPY